ncbi:MAG: phenylalanyl-tRNA synthetase beta chain [Flavobacteriales bacterium]|jgi:phenylalanyl-tRNA synthetase beta chain
MVLGRYLISRFKKNGQMKISFNWLKNYIDTNLPVEKVCEILTDTGLEVEGLETVESVKGGLKGLVIGEVLEKWPHPGADRLNVTKVNLGTGEPVQIVCGAPNVDVGLKVVVATVGTELYGEDGSSFKIKKSKIRGEESHGMICAEDEIGLGKSHDGIMVLDAEANVGTPAAEYFSLESDSIIEIGLTPNRSDAISHIGVARDLAAFLNQEIDTKIVWPKISSSKLDGADDIISIDVRDREGAPRYCGAVMENISVGESPDWLKNVLKAIGVEPINNVVDISNFVMHELGQPLHFFDADKIKGKKVVVRRAKAKEKFITLDGAERELHEEDLMICDENDPMCIAGVFGGIESGVSETTKNIFIESACFNAVSLRKSAKRHQMNTDASFRFERGVDPNGSMRALKRAVHLLEEFAGAKLASSYYDQYPVKVEPLELTVNMDRIYTLIGKVLEEDSVKNILRSLDIDVLEQKSAEWKLAIPTYRVDVTREADVAEEILRIYGYNNIPLPDRLTTSLAFNESPDREKVKNNLSNMFTGMGFTEMMSNSLTNAEYASWMVKEEESIVKILNPLSSELGILRQSILGNGLEAIAYNQNRKNPDLRLFEFGNIYFKKEKGYAQREVLGVFMTGIRAVENWDNQDQGVSYSDLQAVINQTLGKFDLQKGTQSNGVQVPYLQDGIEVSRQKKNLVNSGWVKQEILKSFGIKSDVFYAEFDWNELLRQFKNQKIKVKSISKYPKVRRDFSLLLDESVQFDQIKTIATKTEKRLLKEVDLFDVYEGKNLPKGKKSYAVKFILQDEEATMTDKKVDGIMDAILKGLTKELGAELR